MPLTGLGHVGLHVNDLEAQATFYEEVVGLTITDRDPEMGMVFLSARPNEEHHELLLCRGRDVAPDALMVQQVSFHTSSVEDMIAYNKRFREHNVRIDMIVTHGNAIGIYFYDPEGNRCEVYWKTGLAARQPFLAPIDLDQPVEAVMQRVNDLVARYATTGYIEDPAALTAQNI